MSQPWKLPLQAFEDAKLSPHPSHMSNLDLRPLSGAVGALWHEEAGPATGRVNVVAVLPGLPLATRKTNIKSLPDQAEPKLPR